MARPTKYTKALLKKAHEYVEDFKPTEQELLPTLSGLAYALDIRRETITDWCSQKGKAEFSNLVERMKTKQECMLVSGGLSGGYNSNICKLVLAKHHDYSDKQDSTISNPDGSNLALKVVYE